MAVRNQHAVEAFKPDAGFEDLPLGTLTAVDQEAVFVVFHDMSGKPAPH